MRQYPWYRLLDLETSPRGFPSGRKGRPRSAFPKVRLHVAMTEEELQTLDALVERLEGAFGRQVARGTVIAFTVRYVSEALGDDASLASAKSFEDIVQILDGRNKPTKPSDQDEEAH